MIEIFHAPRTRSNRAIWALEEMGVPYQVRLVDFGGERPQEIKDHNPGNTLPLMIDGDIVLFESVTIMEYAAATYGPTPLALSTDHPNYWPYRQMMLFGEATLAAPLNAIIGTLFRGKPDQQQNFTLEVVREGFRKRVGVVANRLKHGEFAAGDHFTLADISVTYGIDLALKIEPMGLKDLIPAEVADYVGRMVQRDAYKRMVAVK